MKRLALFVVFLLAASIGLHAPPAQAEPILQMQPLQYRSELKSGERQKGFVDITNPTAEPVTVELGVQAFKQADNKGTLSFYDDERLRAGILLDYQEASIPAHKTLRLYFIVDAAKLPTGDIFAAIFARTKPTKDMTMSVRLGTLLLLTNGTPGARQVAIETLSMTPLQAGSALQGSVQIKNTAPPQSASGFFPQISVRAWPFGATKQLEGPLVYAGNTRTVPFILEGNYFGVYKIITATGNSQRTAWVLAATGIWRWLAPISALILAVITVGLFRYLQARKKFVHKG